jgi:deazaflavin-dependent oxidoreductase (nitroreductase family)
MTEGSTQMPPASRDAHADDVRAAARQEAAKHRRLLRSERDGRLLSAIMLLDYAWLWVPPGHGVLTTTGRRTGKRRRKVIRAIRRGNRVYVVNLRPPALAIERPSAVAAWVLNIRANPSVRLKLGWKTYSGLAREIVDPVELGQARAAICDSVHLVDYAEGCLHLRGAPSREAVKKLHAYWFDTGIPLVIELSA